MRVTVEDGTGKRVVIDGDAPEAAKSAWDGQGFAGVLIKAAPERRYTLCIAYPAMKADVKVAQDGFRDFVGPDALEDAAWAYLTKGGDVGLWHAGGTSGAGRCVESYIYRGPDWKLTAADGSEQVVKSGDWCVGIVWSQEGWDAIKAHRINGVSMQGGADRRRPGRETLRQLRR
jgi:hypothetical protein